MEKRKKHGAAFKTKVVLEALTERLTLSELSRKYEVHPNQIQQWKKLFIERAAGVFGQKGAGESVDLEKENRQLFEKIGKLQVENDFLKKVSSIVNR